MTLLRAAIIQFAPVLKDPVTNVNKVASLTKDIRGVDLMVLPELANAGYNYRNPDEAVECSENLESGIFASFLHSLAWEKKCYIVSGINENDRGVLFNTAIIVGPDGFIGKYRKVHLFLNEKEYFQPGNDSGNVFSVKGAKIGLQICFDYLFPEPWGIIARKGADLICHPSNLVTPFAFKVLPAHAVANRIFILTANRTGYERSLRFAGRSQVLDPSGDIVAKASAVKEQVLVKDIDTAMSKNKMITVRNHVFKDRRPECYEE